jgi:subtilase family serine protease
MPAAGRMLAAAVLAAALACGCSASPGRPPARPRQLSPAGLSPRERAMVGTGTAASGAVPPAALLSPAQIRTAYDLWPLYRDGIDGQGQTIVIVDALGSPAIAADLRRFDAAYGLPAPPSLRVIQPAGQVPGFSGSGDATDSTAETSLDVEWAHVIAPAARILLVETPVPEIEGASGFAQIVQAEEYVIRRHLGGVISMSFAATEETFASRAQLLSFRSAFLLAAEPAYRVTMVGATGDQGATSLTSNARTQYLKPVVNWPASDPLVTAVGGTQLSLTGSGSRRGPDVAWPLSGGGRSSVFAAPAYQVRAAGPTAGGDREIPDISMDASCRSAPALYDSFISLDWAPACGTSLSAPLFAGIVALADQVAGHPLGPINPALYRLAAAKARGIVDVVTGDNSALFRQDGAERHVRGYPAGPGYDMVTGLGTVDARYFVPELAKAAGPAPG